MLDLDINVRETRIAAAESAEAFRAGGNQRFNAAFFECFQVLRDSFFESFSLPGAPEYVAATGLLCPQDIKLDARGA